MGVVQAARGHLAIWPLGPTSICLFSGLNAAHLKYFAISGLRFSGHVWPLAKSPDQLKQPSFLFRLWLLAQRASPPQKAPSFISPIGIEFSSIF